MYYWDENAGGIIIENDDTIGFFRIIMNPYEDELLKIWSADIFPKQQVENNTKSKIKWGVSWKPSPGIDYGIIGRFRDKNFVMIRNGTDRKVWIYKDYFFHVCFSQT